MKHFFRVMEWNQRHSQGAVPPKFLAYLVILCFEKRRPKKTVARLSKGVRKGGLGLTRPLELDILKKLYHLRKEINCFRIPFAC